MIEIVICFCQLNDKFLILRRNPQKPQGHKWTAPGGKVEAGETPLQAAQRELFEETGIKLKNPNIIINKGAILHSLLGKNYRLNLFYIPLSNEPAIELNPPEHDAYLWVTPKEALLFPLMEGAIECLTTVFSSLNKEQNILCHQ